MEPFTLPSGVADVKDAMDWMTNKRPKLLKFFCDNVYGRILPRPQSLSFEVLSIKEDALNNTAIRKEIRIHSENNGKKHAFDCLLYIPKNATKPVPAFAGLNFRGNQLTTDELDVRRSGLVPENEANHDKRATQKALWCFRETVARGYASITACYHDIFPDSAAAWDRSALTLFDNVDGFKGCHENYTSIGVWAWGLSRMLDYLESDPMIDASQVGVHGLSRLGKTALWAGATDQRFKMVVSNCSGCGGAALSRRLLGENLFIMHTVFPHWLVKNIEQFIGHEDTAPFDQHELLELAAPPRRVFSPSPARRPTAGRIRMANSSPRKPPAKSIAFSVQKAFLPRRILLRINMLRGTSATTSAQASTPSNLSIGAIISKSPTSILLSNR